MKDDTYSQHDPLANWAQSGTAGEIPKRVLNSATRSQMREIPPSFLPDEYRHLSD